MGMIWYLYKTNLKNRAKKAFKKPITYFYLFLILFYIFVMPFSINIMLEEFGWKSVDKLVAIFAIVAFWLIPGNLISYAKRKGLVFKKADVHFLFTAPVSPKKILLYAHIKNLFVYIIATIIVMLCGIFFFGATVWQTLLYFVVAMILENILESSVMILCYGSEKMGEKEKTITQAIGYGLMAVFVVIAFAAYLREGLSVEMVLNYLHSDAVQMVPVVGWYLATIHLIFMGPTTVNVVCSVLYLVSVVVFLILAVKMPCSGSYYEDAMQFADDYEELLQKKRDGQDARLGKKEKFGKAKVEYKGGGAKALFYKQLLEYKKSKFFFFDRMTVIMLLLGAFIGYIWGQDMQEIREFILPVAMGYIVFCMSAVAGKWANEIKSPYTFLIPDTPMRKLWYATLMEHIKSAVCGALFALPVGIILKLPWYQVALSIIFFTCLQACKIYNTVLAEVMVGNVMGKTGKQLFVMLLQGIVMGIVAAAAVMGTIAFTIEIGYLLMIGALVILAVALMTAANACFDNMEIVE